jgi:hypothetical protein
MCILFFSLCVCVFSCRVSPYSCLRLALDHNPFTYGLLYSWDHRHTPLHWTFLLIGDWLQITIVSVSTSWVEGLQGWASAWCFLFLVILRFELKALQLLVWCSVTSDMSPALPIHILQKELGLRAGGSQTHSFFLGYLYLQYKVVISWRLLSRCLKKDLIVYIERFSLI